jgi:hypothetical protein
MMTELGGIAQNVILELKRTRVKNVVVGLVIRNYPQFLGCLVMKIAIIGVLLAIVELAMFYLVRIMRLL